MRMTQLLLDILKIIEMHLLIWMLIKEDNMSCISFTKASVDLQHVGIICLTDASVKWPEWSNEDYRSGKSDMHERRRPGKEYIAYLGPRLLESKNRYVFIKQ
jgi:hypothetical protein